MLTVNSCPVFLDEVHTGECLCLVRVFTSAQEPPAGQRLPLRMCSLLRSAHKPILPSWIDSGLAHAPQIASIFPWS